MAGNPTPNKLIDEFISSQVVQKGLDERTAKAYRLDLEHLHQWLALEPSTGRERWEGKIETYLDYLHQRRTAVPLRYAENNVYLDIICLIYHHREL